MSVSVASPALVLEAQPAPLAVLLVDDQPFVAEMLRRLIADEPDFAFHYCRDPADAIDQAHAVQPMVVLLDIVMPDIDGMTLCRFLRSDPVTRDLPVIMLSSTEDAEVKAAAFGAGANDYLVKLPEKVELVARLRYHAQAYLTHLQRDAAYRALSESQRQLEALNQELVQLSRQDGLTRIANRRYFNERYREEWERAARHQRPLSLAMIDVDFFKAFNDRYGHLAGDDCLQQVALALKDAARRSTDLLARYGGEEFVALLPELEPAEAAAVAEKLRVSVLSLAIPHDGSQAAAMVTVSLGIASTIPAPQGNPETLIAAADQCLYEAKRQGRNRVVATVLAVGLGDG